MPLSALVQYVPYPAGVAEQYVWSPYAKPAATEQLLLTALVLPPAKPAPL